MTAITGPSTPAAKLGNKAWHGASDQQQQCVTEAILGCF